METKESLAALIKSVAKKAVKTTAGEGLDLENVNKSIDKFVDEERDALAALASLTEEKYPPRLGWLHGNTRQLITLVMTGVFVLLMVSHILFNLFKIILEESVKKSISEITTVFLGVYGPIIGFWFGEKSALKDPKKSR